VARVVVDTPLPHLDRLFDYLVEDSQSGLCVPGCRVRVRFSGKLVDGFVIERVDASEHAGRLAFLERVVSDEVVLTPEVARLARTVADRWAGSMADVLRLAIPPRHASVESKAGAVVGDVRAVPPRNRWDDYAGGPDLVDSVRGSSPRAVVEVTGRDWPALLAELAAPVVVAGRGVIVVLPDHRDVARATSALGATLGAEHVLALAADLGPAERYRRFLRVARGEVRCVVGTRAAVWAPVHDLGLLVVWDDGDDLHAEPRAPYPHARDVAVTRAHLAQAGLVIAGHAVTAESALLVESGWAAAVGPTPEARKRHLPAVRAAGDDDDLARDPAARAARLPTLAWRAARDALAADRPVLVQVPRRGYQPSLRCAQCRSAARCLACAGPLQRTAADGVPACRWCGAVATDWRCGHCGATDLRAVVAGAGRTAEELGRAFPGVAVRVSGGDHVVGDVPERPALVVATPGAEPVAVGGYGAAILLDGWALLGRPDLRAAEEALRRWLNAAALVRSAGDGGRVVVVAPGELRPVQALMRWRPGWHAARELDDRKDLHLPPAVRLAAVTGPPAAVNELLSIAELPAGVDVLGPVAVPTRPGDDEAERLLVRVPRPEGLALALSLHAAASIRSARKSPGAVKVELDPVAIG
jgi:primosomal protein N' (replication factor Y)